MGIHEAASGVPNNDYGHHSSVYPIKKITFIQPLLLKGERLHNRGWGEGEVEKRTENCHNRKATVVKTLRNEGKAGLLHTLNPGWKPTPGTVQLLIPCRKGGELVSPKHRPDPPNRPSLRWYHAHQALNMSFLTTVSRKVRGLGSPHGQAVSSATGSNDRVL